MHDSKGKRAFVTDTASETGKGQATDWFLQYPVMSTLRPSYPRGPWHYQNGHQLVVTYESTAEAVLSVLPSPLQPAEGNHVTIEWRRIEGRQHLWDMTLSDGEVVHDYLSSGRT